MSEDFRDPFSEDELQRMLAGGEESPAAGRVRKLLSSLWEFFGAANSQVGDARTVGFIVILELEDTSGGRWLRYAMGDGHGRPLQSWTARGYLGDCLSYVDKVYDRMASEFTSDPED